MWFRQVLLKTEGFHRTFKHRVCLVVNRATSIHRSIGAQPFFATLYRANCWATSQALATAGKNMFRLWLRHAVPNGTVPSGQPAALPIASRAPAS